LLASELIVVTPLLLVLPELDLPELLEVPELEGIPELEPVAPDPDPMNVIPVPEEPELPGKPELDPEPPGMVRPASGRSGESDEPQPLNKPRTAVANTTELRMVLPPVTVMTSDETDASMLYHTFGKWLFQLSVILGDRHKRSLSSDLRISSAGKVDALSADLT
jgi:hypothetical protein